MIMPDISYSLRFVVLLAFAAAMVLLDRLLHRENSVRIWEYVCLFLVGGIGALYGAANDAVTVTLSSEYFIFGKGLSVGPQLTFNAIRLGAQAGFSAGAVACAVWQFALRRIPAPKRCSLILKHFWIPLSLACALSFVCPVLFATFDPLSLIDQFDGIIPPNRFSAFMTVWWIHMGAYLGLTAGLALVILKTRKSAVRTRNNRM